MLSYSHNYCWKTAVNEQYSFYPFLTNSTVKIVNNWLKKLMKTRIILQIFNKIIMRKFTNNGQ